MFRKEINFCCWCFLNISHFSDTVTVCFCALRSAVISILAAFILNLSLSLTKNLVNFSGGMLSRTVLHYKKLPAV